eukprot:CAMPEP_0168490664 /NCGR_PEP_ID=MMETSP0228-20121227/69302_1 /TAXON_ID=133427 /ORGANISM="Protoceratium reticulatum, Strain CCCM 535 (=CCMP 1889)" /LENGTH=102 /DNA_ID=CAMNT_0008507387 /DNA_START=373 /DNA_END=681 /DNA_ORIENTATION=-
MNARPKAAAQGRHCEVLSRPLAPQGLNDHLGLARGLRRGILAGRLLVLLGVPALAERRARVELVAFYRHQHEEDRAEGGYSDGLKLLLHQPGEEEGAGAEER